MEVLKAGFVLGTALSAIAAAGPTFVDVTRSAGITHQTVFGAVDRNTYILETTGTGVGWFDYDNDGVLDLFFTNGTRLGNAAPAESLRLYRGRGDGTFADVTERAGVTRVGWGQGVAIGDYDNDGHRDVYVTFFGRNVLFRNQGDGTFADVTARAGVAAGGWSTSAAWADYDGDGRLDLFVARYIAFDPATAPLPGAVVPGVNCSYRGFPVMCGPRGLTGVRDLLFRNNGDGTFADVTEAAGIDTETYRGLGVVWGDYDNDGRLDVLVANDAQPNQLYRNRGDRTFEELALLAGVAVDEDGRARAGMGVDFADYDNDGWLDAAIGNFFGEPNSLYRNRRDGTFDETTWSSGVGPPTVPTLTWGTRFFDYDNDGWKDLIFVNGHVYPEVDAHHLDETYAQRALLLRNMANGRFTSVGSAAGQVWDERWAGRGAAVADYDNDGDLDLALAVVNAPPILLQNRVRSGNWLSLTLVGTKSPRDAVGARVTITVGDRRLTEDVRGGGSYLAHSDSRVHAGLGSSTRVDAVDIRWPSGATDHVGRLDANQFLIIKEGEGVISRRKP